MSISIFNGETTSRLNIPRETDHYIISFLDDTDKVVLSGVNKTAYKVLSNNIYFKELFFSKYCPFEKGYSEGHLIFEKKLKRFSDNHQSNCWKVFCCVIQTGKMTFSLNFMQETTRNEIERSILKNPRCEVRIKEICGNFYADPSSLIDQAWKAFEAQKSIVRGYEKQLPHFEALTDQILVSEERKDEWRKLVDDQFNKQSISREEYVSAVEKFDARLVPVIECSYNYVVAGETMEQLHKEYTKLETERVKNKKYIENFDAHLNKLKTEGSDQDRKLLRKIMFQHFLNVLDLKETTNDDIYQAFKIWVDLSYPNNIKEALGSLSLGRHDVYYKLVTRCDTATFVRAYEENAKPSTIQLAINELENSLSPGDWIDAIDAWTDALFAMQRDWIDEWMDVDY